MASIARILSQYALKYSAYSGFGARGLEYHGFHSGQEPRSEGVQLSPRRGEHSG
jgi:hypothetical protein